MKRIFYSYYMEMLEDLKDLSKSELFKLIIRYDNYIYNDGEPWNKDRQPIGILEFYNNEYREEDKED